MSLNFNENHVDNLIIPILSHKMINDQILKSVIADLVNISKGVDINQIIIFLESNLKNLNNNFNKTIVKDNNTINTNYW